MAIEKQINIVVKEQGLDTVQKQVDKLDNSLENLSDTQKGVAKSMVESSNAVLENGGAMGLLNDATGGLAMTVKDAVEASWLFTKSEKAKAIATSISTTVVGTATGAMKAFRIAVATTGIGAIIIGLGLLVANFDKVKKAILSVVPGLAKVGKFFSGLVDTVTDFVGITSDATRELDRLGKEANKTLDKNKFFLEAYGDKYDEYTKRKIEANNKYAEQVKAINENEELGEAEKLRRLKILRETANREILKAETDRNKALAEKRKEEAEKQAEEEKKRRDEANQKEKERQQKVLDSRKEFLQKASEIEKEFERLEDEKRAKDYQASEAKKTQYISELEARQRGAQAIAEADKKEADDRIATEELVRDAKFDIANQTLSLLAEVAGKGSKIGKAIAIAQTTISGIEGVQNAFTTASKSPITALFPAYPYIQAGLAGAFSAVQLAKLAKGEKATAGSSGGGGGSSAPSAPSFNLVQGTGSNQIATSIGKQQPIQAYVVSKNVTNAQELDRNIVKSASL